MDAAARQIRNRRLARLLLGAIAGNLVIVALYLGIAFAAQYVPFKHGARLGLPGAIDVLQTAHAGTGHSERSLAVGVVAAYMNQNRFTRRSAD